MNTSPRQSKRHKGYNEHAMLYVDKVCAENPCLCELNDLYDTVVSHFNDTPLIQKVVTVSPNKKLNI